MSLNPPSAPRTANQAAWITCLLVLPWIQPWAPSPQPNVVPLLISWGCMGLLLLSGQRVHTQDMAQAWALAALISSAMGLLQYFGSAFLLSPWLHVPGLGEANANLRQRNQLATLIATGMLAVLWWQAHGLKTRHALWMLAWLAVGHAATNSRTGLLHMLLVLGLSTAWAWRSRLATHRTSAWLALWALLVYLLASWVLPSLLQTYWSHDSVNALARMAHNEGCGSRRVLWRNVLHLISQKPWWGWGWEDLKYAHYITAYPGEATDRFCDILGNAHNLPLQLAVTLGVPAAALILGLGVAVLLRMRPWTCKDRTSQLAWGVLAVIGLHSLLEFPLWYGPFQMAVLLCSVLLWPAEAPAPWRRWPHARTALGGLVLIGVALVAVDYARVRQIYLPASQRSLLWRDDPLGAAHSSWFFTDTAQFAELSLTRVTPENADWVLRTSQAMLHHSPEPVVIQKLIESARLLGQNTLADLHQVRMRTAFPQASSAP